MLAIALLGLLFCQDPALPPSHGAGQEKQAKSTQKSSSKALKTWPDKEAREKVKAFERQLRPKKVSMRVRKEALDSLAGGINLQLIKPIGKFIEKESSIVLKRQAIKMLSDQPEMSAHKTILKLLKKADLTSNPQVEAGLITALSRAGYVAKDWPSIKDVFESDYDNERIPVHEAVLKLVTEHKESQAIPMLLRNLEEPNPENVEIAENPPTAYWKARWHAWAVWKGQVKDALFTITGQRFSTAKEALSWLQKNPIKAKNKKKRRR